MSFNRLSYDKCAYDVDVKQSVSPLDYQLFVGKYENDKPCPCNSDNSLKSCNVEFGTRADVENELYNLNRPGTLCPSKKYDPKDKNNFSHNYHPPTLCQGIYHLTPTGLKEVKGNGLTEINTKIEKC